MTNYNRAHIGFEFEISGSVSNIYELIDNTNEFTGYADHRINMYHGTKRRTSQGLWRVEKDCSVIRGAEFISPPQPYEEAIEVLNKFFAAIKKTEGIYITDECGLHVNISIDKQVNKALLFSNIDSSLLYSLWPQRLTNEHVYCQSCQQLLHINTLFISKLKGKGSEVNKFANYLLKTDYAFIKSKRYNSKNYYEIRVPGGKDYHLKEKEVIITINHVINAMCNSTSKNITSKEIKKMISYINKAQKYGDTKLYIGNQTIASKILSNYDKEVNIYSLLYFVRWAGGCSSFDLKKINDNFILYYLIKRVLKTNCISYNLPTYLYLLFKKTTDENMEIKIATEETTKEKLMLLRRCIKKEHKPLRKALIGALNDRAIDYLQRHEKRMKGNKILIKQKLKAREAL